MKLSVIIPCYNRKDFVCDTIANVLSQTRKPNEIIIVDDGSSDGSADVIENRFGDAVHVIRQENQGPGAARNRGFKASSGELIQFMDSDDLWSINKLAVQEQALIKSNADFAYCPWIRSSFSGDLVTFEGPVLQAEAVPSDRSLLEWHLGTWCLVFQNCLFKRALLEQAGCYRTDLMPSEDSEYLLRILLLDPIAVHTKSCLTFYRCENEGQQQITGAGLNEESKAADQTKYFQVVGDQLQPIWGQLCSDSQKEFLLAIWRHNQFCEKQGFSQYAESSFAYSLLNQHQTFPIMLGDFSERINRKLKRVLNQIPNSIGLMCRDSGAHEIELAQSIGLTVNFE